MDREFKQGMADLIYKLSQAIDPECRPMSRDRLTTMVELISEQIDTSNKLSKSLKTYEKICNRIIAGELRIYNLSVTNLMQAFQTQSEFIYYHD